MWHGSPWVACQCWLTQWNKSLSLISWRVEMHLSLSLNSSSRKNHRKVEICGEIESRLELRATWKWLQFAEFFFLQALLITPYSYIVKLSCVLPQFDLKPTSKFLLKNFGPKIARTVIFAAIWSHAKFKLYCINTTFSSHQRVWTCYSALWLEVTADHIDFNSGRSTNWRWLYQITITLADR